MRVHSIRTRIFGGFTALILLQAVVGVSVWRADHRVEVANAADVVAETALERISTVRSKLLQLQLVLAEFVRTGLASDRERVDVALATIGTSLVEIGSGEDASGELALSIKNVRSALDAAVTASVVRRDKQAALVQAGKGVEAGFASLAQASTKSPERDTVESISSIGAESTHALLALQRYASTGDIVEAQALQSSTATLKDGLSGVQKNTVGMTSRLLRIIGTVTASLDELPPAMDAFGRAWLARSASLVQMEETAGKARAVIAERQVKLAAQRTAQQAEIASARGGVRTTVLTAGIASALIGIGLAVIVGLSITRPIGRLAAAMRRIADGALNTDVPEQRRRDEIGGMAAAVQVFKDNGLKAVALEAEVTAARAAAEFERARIDAEQAREAAEDQVAITALAHGLNALANGDLTHQITEDIAPKTRQLKDDFNATAARLRETITTIAGAIQGMTNGTGEISQAADDLSRRTEQQAASLEQTAAALDQITATVRKTAEGAIHVQAVVSTAKTDAEQSSGVVREAVVAMNEIEKSSKEVSQIIGVIDEIAFQTNLLALNAGVEAARAGDAGRGFAVVASEVRALAQRSAHAAKEIKQLISTSSNQVGQGVKLVNETGESLQRIVGHVAEVYLAITEIAASAKEQASGLDEVNVAVNQMDQVTQQNAAMVEQSTAASHCLAQETTELSRLTGYFQVGSLQIATSNTPATQSTRLPKPVVPNVVARIGRHRAVAST